MIRVAIGVALCGMVTALAAQTGFEFSPIPRWAKEPESEELCKAIRAECAAFRSGDIDASMGLDELYDAKGFITGVRMTRSTGCRPLDESMLLSRKEFRQRFEQNGDPSLDDYRLELRPGTDPAAARIVRHTEDLQIGMGCATD